MEIGGGADLIGSKLLEFSPFKLYPDSTEQERDGHSIMLSAFNLPARLNRSRLKM